MMCYIRSHAHSMPNLSVLWERGLVAILCENAACAHYEAARIAESKPVAVCEGADYLFGLAKIQDLDVLITGYAGYPLDVCCCKVSNLIVLFLVLSPHRCGLTEGKVCSGNMIACKTERKTFRALYRTSQ